MKIVDFIALSEECVKFSFISASSDLHYDSRPDGNKFPTSILTASDTSDGYRNHSESLK